MKPNQHEPSDSASVSSLRSGSRNNGVTGDGISQQPRRARMTLRAAKDAIVTAQKNQIAQHHEDNPAFLPYYAQEYAQAHPESYFAHAGSTGDKHNEKTSSVSSPRIDYATLRKEMRELGYDMHDPKTYAPEVLAQAEAGMHPYLEMRLKI